MMKFSSSIKKIISSAKHKVSPTSTSGAGLQGKVLIKKRKQELLAVQWLRLHAPMQGDRFYRWLGKQDPCATQHCKKREREKESKQIHCMTLINFARKQEIEKIFPAKMWRRGEAAFVCWGSWGSERQDFVGEMMLEGFWDVNSEWELLIGQKRKIILGYTVCKIKNSIQLFKKLTHWAYLQSLWGDHESIFERLRKFHITSM